MKIKKYLPIVIVALAVIISARHVSTHVKMMTCSFLLNFSGPRTIIPP